VIDGGPCELAASCLCGGADAPADGVLVATVTSSYQAQITATFGDTTGFSVGDAICVNQSAVGATILVPVQSGGDAAHVVLVPDGETCVPNFAFTVQLDDGGRPLACNSGIESAIPLTTQQAVDALRAQDCAGALAVLDSRWAQNECSAPGGCRTSPWSASPLGAASLIGLVLVAVLSFRRARSRSSSGCRASR
jgi:hypothetical protein